MSSVSDLAKNKDEYNEYKQYFESIATNLNAIGHNPVSHPAFVRYDLIEMFDKKWTKLMSPFLGLEDPTIGLVNNAGENIQQNYTGAFTIAYQCKADDQSAIEAAYDNALILAKKVLAKIKSDRRNRKIFDFDFNSVRFNKIHQIFGDYHGWRIEFSFPSQFSMLFDLNDWTNETDAIAPAPFATVTDGMSDVKLAQGDTYICSTDEGVLVLKDSDGNILQTISVPPGSTVLATAPDNVATVNSTPFTTAPAGTSIDVPVQYENGNFVGSIIGGIVQIPDPIDLPALAITTYDDVALTNPITAAKFKQTIYINAEEDGIIATSFTIYIDNGVDAEFSVNQASSTLAYDVALSGTIKIQVIAFDGLGIAVARYAPKEVVITGGRSPWVSNPPTTNANSHDDDYGNIWYTYELRTATAVPAGEFARIELQNNVLQRSSFGNQQYVGFVPTVNAGTLTGFTGLYWFTSTRVDVYVNGSYVMVMYNPTTNEDDSPFVDINETTGLFEFGFGSTVFYISTHAELSGVTPTVKSIYGNRGLNEVYITRTN